MRTIKFRGKSLSGEWLYGYLYKHGITPPSDFLCIGQAVLPWKDTVGVYVVDPETIGQFTGLYDKNGKEIYEGDIVSHPWKDPIFGDLVETGQFVHSTICFNNGAFVVNYRLQGEYIYLQDFVRLKCLEVVGNIHDNPELIKKGGERMIKINDKITEDEVNDVVNQCVDSEEEGASRWPGMTYEQGVKAAIEWLQGYGDNPMED